MYQCYTWHYQITVPPYERLMDVLDAFFLSYPRGEYTSEARGPYKLEFRRGHWKRLLGLGPLVPGRLPAAQFQHWPILVHVMARPSPEAYLITVRYELYLPRSVRKFPNEVQTSFDQHARQELDALAAYLAQCMSLPELPAVSPQ